jgi:hypothetical protein
MSGFNKFRNTANYGKNALGHNTDEETRMNYYNNKESKSIWGILVFVLVLAGAFVYFKYFQ